MEHIFLETTIQIHRLLDSGLGRQTINQTIAQYETVTSTYVWMEVQRTVSQDYQYLTDLLLTKQPTTFVQLFRLLGEGENLYSLRSLKRLIHITTQLLDDLKTTTINPLLAAYQLKEQRQWLLHHEFFADVQQVLDTTQCDLVRPDYRATGSRMSCRRATARCALPDLLKQHAISMQQLRRGTIAPVKLETKTERVLNAIEDDFALAKGEKNCWSLGDLIITLECPPDTMLWTTNVQHFEPLCDAFGRKLFQPSEEKG